MKFSWKSKAIESKKPSAVSAAIGRFATTVDSPAQIKRSIGSVEDLKETLKDGKTTVATAAASASAPARNVIGSVGAAIAEKMNRDRRDNERRHGRADQRAPGTRTRMLKIIYDKRKDFFMQRRKALIVKAVVVLAIVFGLGYGGYTIYSAASSTTSRVVSKVDPNGWWKNVSQAAPKNTSSRAAYQASSSNAGGKAVKVGKHGKKISKARKGKKGHKVGKAGKHKVGKGKAKRAHAKGKGKKSKRQLAKR